MTLSPVFRHYAHKCQRWALNLAALAFLWLALLYLLGDYRILATNFVNVSDAPGMAPAPITLPYNKMSDFSRGQVPKGLIKRYMFIFDVIGYKPQGARWRLLPDGCITRVDVNGRAVPLKSYNPKALCSGSGITIDFSDYLRSGQNRIRVHLSDPDGETYGFNIKRVLPLWRQNYYNLINTQYIFVAWVAGYLFFATGLGRFATVLGALATVVYFRNGYLLSFTEYAPDWWGHRDYVNFMLNNWRIPSPNQGWETYHPPLYYVLSAIAEYFTRPLKMPEMFGAKLVSLAAVTIYNIYALHILRRCISHRIPLYLCTIVLLAWPLVQTFGNRVSNEVLCYTLWAGVYYHLLAWCQDKDPKQLARALAMCGLMLLVKVSAIVPLGTCFVIVMWEMHFKRFDAEAYLENKKILLAIALVAACVLFSFGRIAYFKYYYAPNMSMIISNMHMDPFHGRIFSENTLYYLTYFDVYDIAHKPFVRFLYDEDARLLLNTYIKTALFGYYDFPLAWQAIRLNICLALLFVFALIAPVTTRSINRTQSYLGLMLLVGYAAHVINRLISKSIITHDARLTFPLLVILIAWIGSYIEQNYKNGHYLEYIAGITLLGSFAVIALHIDIVFTRAQYLLPL